VANVKVQGVKELRATVGNLIAALDKDERSKYGKIAYDTMADASKYLRDAIRNEATSQGWRRASIAAVFWYGEIKRQYSGIDGRETGFSRRLRANLVGIRKGAPPRQDPDIYAEWKAGANNTSPKRKRSGGQTIGQSFASMFEFGTSKMAARPAFRPAYQKAKPTIRQMIIDGYTRIIDDVNRTV
jgi:hypothetical protein